MPCTMRDDSHAVWNGYECSDTCMHGKVCHANVPCMRSVMQCGMDSLITSERRGHCATEINQSMSALTHAFTARCAMPCAMHDECHAVWNGQSHTWCMKAAIHSLASLWVPCGGFASPSSLPASLHVWAWLPGFGQCSVCSCVGFAYSNVSAVPDHSVKLSCIRPLLSLLLSLAVRLVIPHCMTLIITPLLPMSLQFQTVVSDSPACDLYSRLR